MEKTTKKTRHHHTEGLVQILGKMRLSLIHYSPDLTQQDPGGDILVLLFRSSVHNIIIYQLKRLVTLPEYSQQ